MNILFSLILRHSVVYIPVFLLVILLRSLVCHGSAKDRLRLWYGAAVSLVIPAWISLPVSGKDFYGDALMRTARFLYRAEETVSVQVSYFQPAYLWAAGILVMVIVSAPAGIRLYMVIRRASVRSDGILLSEETDTAFTAGIWKPVIVLPVMTAEEEEYVLRHEHMHVRSHDNLYKGIGWVLVCLYWFHPLVWISYVLFGMDTEIACDEEVSSGMNHTERRKYADILLKYASMQTAPWRNAFGGKKQETEERIRHIMEGKHRERKVLSAFCALVIMSGCMVEASEMTGENTEKNPESAAEVQSEEMQFAQPVRDSEVTCGYGCYAGHYGEDVLSNDSDILAAADGIVSETGFDTKYGNYIILSHTDEYYTFYASLESIACTDKQHVSAGEVIGKMGSTGMSTGTHLHFAIRRIYGNPSDLLTHMAGEIEGDEIYTLFE